MWGTLAFGCLHGGLPAIFTAVRATTARQTALCKRGHRFAALQTDAMGHIEPLMARPRQARGRGGKRRVAIREVINGVMTTF